MVVGEIATGTEVIVIGGGPGGYVAAIRAAQLGKDVTLVEEADLGGICLNHGCIPSKALIHAASFAHDIKNAEEIGIKVDKVEIDIAKLQEWKGSVVKKLTSGVEHLCKGNKIEVIKGRALFDSSDKARVTTADGHETFLNFKHAIIATGSKPIEIPSLKFDGEKIISSREALSLKIIPKEMVIVGGGYIGLELGTVYAKLGTKVKVVELMDQILPGNDLDVVNVIQKRMEALGVEFYLNTKVEGAETGDRVKVSVSKDDEKTDIETDIVLVCVGRKPNTSGIGLEKLDIEPDEKGFISVDETQRTSNHKIFAIGDIVAGRPMLAHKASKEGKVAAEVIAGKKSAFDNTVIPSVVFTDPEFAIAGLNEVKAKEQGYEYKMGKFPFKASGKAIASNDDDGFAKIISADSQILGVQIVGQHASDMISEAVLAIEMGATVEDLALIIHPHPTLPETLGEAAEAVLGDAIHILNPK